MSEETSNRTIPKSLSINTMNRILNVSEEQPKSSDDLRKKNINTHNPSGSISKMLMEEIDKRADHINVTPLKSRASLLQSKLLSSSKRTNSPRNRYSLVHKKQFHKMDSIANHYAAHRKENKQTNTLDSTKNTINSPLEELNSSKQNIQNSNNDSTLIISDFPTPSGKRLALSNQTNFGSPMKKRKTELHNFQPSKYPNTKNYELANDTNSDDENNNINNNLIENDNNSLKTNLQSKDVIGKSYKLFNIQSRVKNMKAIRSVSLQEKPTKDSCLIPRSTSLINTQLSKHNIAHSKPQSIIPIPTSTSSRSLTSSSSSKSISRLKSKPSRANLNVHSHNNINSSIPILTKKNKELSKEEIMNSCERNLRNSSSIGNLRQSSSLNSISHNQKQPNSRYSNDIIKDNEKNKIKDYEYETLHKILKVEPSMTRSPQIHNLQALQSNDKLTRRINKKEIDINDTNHNISRRLFPSALKNNEKSNLNSSKSQGGLNLHTLRSASSISNLKSNTHERITRSITSNKISKGAGGEITGNKPAWK